MLPLTVEYLPFFFWTQRFTGEWKFQEIVKQLDQIEKKFSLDPKSTFCRLSSPPISYPISPQKWRAFHSNVQRWGFQEEDDEDFNNCTRRTSTETPCIHSKEACSVQHFLLLMSRVDVWRNFWPLVLAHSFQQFNFNWKRCHCNLYCE